MMLGRLFRWLRGLFLPKRRKLTEQQLAMQRKAEEDMRRSQLRKRESFRRADLPPGTEYPGGELQMDDAGEAQAGVAPNPVVPEPRPAVSELEAKAGVSSQTPQLDEPPTAFQQWQEKQEATAGKELSAFQKHRYVRPGDTPELNVESPPPAIFPEVGVVESGVEEATDSTDGAPPTTVVPASPAGATALPAATLPDVSLPPAPPPPPEAPDADVLHGKLPDVPGDDVPSPANRKLPDIRGGDRPGHSGSVSPPPPHPPPAWDPAQPGFPAERLPDVAPSPAERTQTTPLPDVQAAEAVQQAPEPRTGENTTPGRPESLPANDVDVTLPELPPSVTAEQRLPDRESPEEADTRQELPLPEGEARADREPVATIRVQPRAIGFPAQGFVPGTFRELPEVTTSDESPPADSEEAAEQSESLVEIQETMDGLKEAIAKLEEVADKTATTVDGLQEIVASNAEALNTMTETLSRIEQELSAVGGLR